MGATAKEPTGVWGVPVCSDPRTDHQLVQVSPSLETPEWLLERPWDLNDIRETEYALLLLSEAAAQLLQDIRYSVPTTDTGMGNPPSYALSLGPSHCPLLVQAGPSAT